MRSDMSKVIVERPRLKGASLRGQANKIRNSKIEEMPTKESMKETYGWNQKEFNDFLAPIRRYLRKQVGRPWNDVYSEICKNLNPNNPLHQHVKGHVFDFVDANISVNKKGEYLTNSKYGRVSKLEGSTRFETLWVDPADGILKLIPKQKFASVNAPLTHFEVDGNIYHKDNGIWYQVEMKEFPPDRSYVDQYGKTILFGNYQYDVILKKTIQKSQGIYRNMSYYYYSSKEQLSTKDLKKLGLQND